MCLASPEYDEKKRDTVPLELTVWEWLLTDTGLNPRRLCVTQRWNRDAGEGMVSKVRERLLALCVLLSPRH